MQVGTIVLYHPGAAEGFAGGHAPVPAIIVGAGGGDGALDLAVIDRSARIVLRSRPLSADAWAERGRDPAVGHWAPVA